LPTSLYAWLRHGRDPPTLRTVLRDARERLGAAVAMGLVLSAAGVVIGVNLLSLSDWYLPAANHMALIVLLIIGAYVFFVMAATEARGLHRQIGGARPLGIGSLHWTTISALAVAIAEAVMLRFAVASSPLPGAGLPFLAVALILRPVLTDLDQAVTAETETPADTPSDPRALTEGHLA